METKVERKEFYYFPNWEIVQNIEKILPALLKQIAAEAKKYGEFRGGLAVGFKDKKGVIYSTISIVNPDLPSRRGGEEDQYDLYAGLKLGTALRLEKNTEKLDPENLPLMAVHPGGVVHFDEASGMWYGVAYSGHSGEEDEILASRMLKTFFFPR